jgi:hypothetical protein
MSAGMMELEAFTYAAALASVTRALQCGLADDRRELSTHVHFNCPSSFIALPSVRRSRAAIPPTA